MTGSFAIGSLPTTLPLTAFHAPPLLVPPRRPFRSLTRRRPLVSTHRPLHALHGDATHNGGPDAADADGIDERGGFSEYGAPGSQPIWKSAEDLQREELGRPLYLLAPDKLERIRQEKREEAILTMSPSVLKNKAAYDLKTASCIPIDAPERPTQDAQQRQEMVARRQADEARRQREKEEQQTRQQLVYSARKARLLSDLLLLLVVGFSLQWGLVGVQPSLSYAFGGIFGLAYVQVLGRYVEALGAEKQRLFNTPIRLLVPGVMMYVWSRQPDLLPIFPLLEGFFTFQLATLLQGLVDYEDDKLLEDYDRNAFLPGVMTLGGRGSGQRE